MADGLTQPALTPEALAESNRRKAEKERKRAAAATAAQPQVDPIEAARAVLARTGEITAKYGDFRLKRDAALEREQEALGVYRDLYGKHRSRLNDTRWCATDEGRNVVSTLKALRDEVDRLSGITPLDVDYKLLWAARIARYHSDYVECVLAASGAVVSPHGDADAILVAINEEQEEALRAQGVQNKFFFRAEGQTYYPNGYKARPEVQRVVRELQQLWGRTIQSFKWERARTAELLGLHAPDRIDSASVPLDLVRIMSVAEASPYEGGVNVSLYFSKFEFLAPGETEPWFYRGVVHLSVENTTDPETGGPAKILTTHEVVGSIERTLPAAGMRWLIAIEKVGDGELGVRKGPNRLDDPQPWALLRCIQNVLFVARKRGQTIGQALGLEAYKGYESRRQAGRRRQSSGTTQPDGTPPQGEEPSGSAPGIDDTAPNVGGAEAQAAPEAQAPAAEALATLPPQKPRRPRGMGGTRKKKAGPKASGDNGAEGPVKPVPEAAN